MPAATVDHSQRICEVWANNLEEELKRIRHVIRKYNYIAMVGDAQRDVDIDMRKNTELDFLNA